MTDPVLANVIAAAQARAAGLEPPPIDFAAPWDLAPEEDEEEAAPASAPTPESVVEMLLPLSFADRGFLLKDAAATGRFALETMRGAQAAMGRAKRRRVIYCAGPGGAPLPAGFAGDDGVDIINSDDPGAILGAITPKTAGILIAPIRTAPTLEIPARGLLAVLRETTDEYGITLAFDETASGLCRTGMIWAYEWTGVTPDLMIVGQGLAGAEPLGAVLATAKVARGAPRPPELDPASLAHAEARLRRVLAPDFTAEVQRRTWALEDKLIQLSHNHRPTYPAIVGTGLMQGLVCEDGADAFATRAALHGLRTLPLGKVLGLFPSLTVSDFEIDRAAEILGSIAGASVSAEAQPTA